MTHTFGIEEELLVVEAATGELSPRGGELLEAARPELGGRVVAELSRCQVETNTDVCTTLDDASRQLRQLRDGLARAGEGLGLRPVALASHPWSTWHDQSVNTDTAHYRDLLDRYQHVARRTVIGGCHIHVGVDDPDDRVRALAGVAPWLAVLLALSANSPWWEGVDTGYASYRMQVWQSWPTATMPPVLRNDAALRRLVTSLQAVEAIEDASGLHWHVRPSAKLPTVELRVADVCIDSENAVTLAGLARALVATTLAGGVDLDDPPPAALLDAGLWRASRHGLDATLVDPTSAVLRPACEVVDALVAHVAVALDNAGDTDRVGDGLAALMARGNGARAQRAVLVDPALPWPDALERMTASR